MKWFYFVLLSVVIVSPTTLLAYQKTDSEKSADPQAKQIDTGLLSAFKFRSIGPALMSGRIADIAIDCQHPNTWYAAAGSGGVWKTVNAGTTWKPIFDHYGSYSIGCVTIDPQNPSTIWVGTGENVGGRHVGFGDGIYVSHDAGKTFKNMGLGETEHLSKIIVHPHDSDTIYVAAQGPLWSGGGQRGLYKSTDGGKNWRAVLTKGKWTGVTDVVIDSENPKTLYAATHQRHRTVAALLNGGPESGVYKSIDGGENWTELTNGIPGGDKGKIGLAISPQKSNVIYATIELPGRKGGFFRSEDFGVSFRKMSNYASGGTGPHYYQEIWPDPHRFDVVYHANVQLGRTEDGGKTFRSVGNENKHVDNHAIGFHPTDPDFVLVGCDGGLYKSHDYCRTYDFIENLPLTQFYKIDVDNDWPVYHVVGGTQDNNTQYGPARTLGSGIRNADWGITIGGDGHDCAIDPQDANIIYCESQQGYLRRFDRLTGESVDIRPQPGPGEDYFRFNWDSPILISPHDHRRLYFGSKHLHRSDDRGDSWQTISDDLSRNQDRFKMKIMGRIWSIDATWDLMAMSQYGNITSISESPVKAGLIYVGTDDGFIHVTEDGGKKWRKIEKIFGIPEMFFVNDIKADQFDENTVYACVDNHKEGDFAPYIIKSSDRGENWERINGNLPDRHLCWRIIQDHEVADLMFVGTEFGAFVTLDGGQKWHKISGAPNIPFRDLEIQRRENDLVGATFGRGIFVLDDYAPLRKLTTGMLESDFQFLPVKKAMQYVPERKLGGRQGSQGDSYFVADNPPFGATITYFLKEGFKTKKQQRMDREAELKKVGKDSPYPGWDAIKAEDRETRAALIFEITDSGGNMVDRFPGKSSAGIQRVNWNLRYAPLTARPGRAGIGPMVAPGKYTITAFRVDQAGSVQLGEPAVFDVELIRAGSLKNQSPEKVVDFQMKVGKLQQSVTAANQALQDAIKEVTQVRDIAKDNRKIDWKIVGQASQLHEKLLDAEESLNGDPTKTRRYAVGAPSISSRIQNVLFGTYRQTYGPTKTNREQFKIAKQEYQQLKKTIEQLIEKDLESLRESLDQSGAPWTPGRKIPEP